MDERVSFFRVDDAPSAAAPKRHAAPPTPKVVASRPQTRAAAPKQAVAAARRPPELDRHLHVFQSLGSEGAAELKIGQNGGLETWILGRSLGRDLALADLGAHPVDEAFRAERDDA